MLKLILSLVPYCIMSYVMIITVHHSIKTNTELEKIKSDNVILCMEVERLRHLLNCQTHHDNYHSKSNSKVSSEIIDAVKFAMIKAHPDNPGGSSERFIKYKKIYDEINRR